MRKCWFLVGLILWLLSWLLMGCGVNQEQYDTVIADLGKVQLDLQSIKADYEKLISEYKDLQDEKPSLNSEGESLKAAYDELRAEYENLQAEKESLQADYNQLNTRNAAVNRELTEIKESHDSVCQELSALQAVYPPKHFSTLQELKSWVSSNAISDTPIHDNLLVTYKAYVRALEIQEAALRDGYIISVVSIKEETFTRIGCMAKLDNGIYYWVPDKDDIQRVASIVTEQLALDRIEIVPIEPRLDWERYDYWPSL